MLCLSSPDFFREVDYQSGDLLIPTILYQEYLHEATESSDTRNYIYFLTLSIQYKICMADFLEQQVISCLHISDVRFSFEVKKCFCAIHGSEQ